jgi:hypothetical protein
MGTVPPILSDSAKQTQLGGSGPKRGDNLDQRAARRAVDQRAQTVSRLGRGYRKIWPGNDVEKLATPVQTWRPKRRGKASPRFFGALAHVLQCAIGYPRRRWRVTGSRRFTPGKPSRSSRRTRRCGLRLLGSCPRRYTAPSRGSDLGSAWHHRRRALQKPPSASSTPAAE